MSTTKQRKETKAARKARAAKIAKMRKEGATGDAIREALGQDLTGAKRRALLREFGHDGLIAPSYDRAEAKAKREAQTQEA